MAYTVKLVSLECFVAQELDGDEIYINLNGVRVWQAHPDKMTHVPKDDHHVSQFDFAGGRKQTHSGWVTTGAVAFKGHSGMVTLQLWDADVGSRDDLLGETPIDESQASGGEISVIFRRDGAHYRLTYQVEVEA